MATGFPIHIDLNVVLDATRAAVDEKVLPSLNQAVHAVAQQTQINWMEAVRRARLWSGERDDYMQSIDMQMTGPFSAMVWSDYRHAEAIETGRPARDLKRMLDTSLKVRATKDGRRFLVIPFRHNTPGHEGHAPSMPQHVYAQAQHLEPSRIIGHTRRVSGTGAMHLKTRTPLTVPQMQYQWGGRLLAGSMGPNSRGKTDRYAGMVRFDASADGKRSSVYLTFRTMMDGSRGWIVPAQPGLHLAENVAKEMQPLAEAAFREAVKRDLG